MARLSKSIGLEYSIPEDIQTRDPVTFTIYYQKVQADQGRKSTWVIQDEEQKHMISHHTVEACAQHHFAKLGYRSIHAENSLPTTLFGLLFLDILFMSVPRVFQNAFQDRPLDYGTSAFYTSRQTEIEARLSEIEDGQGLSILTKAYAEQAAQRPCIVGVNWELPLADLSEMIIQLGPRRLRRLMQPYAIEAQALKGGFPDLTVWKPASTPVEKGILFVEVKGPNDTLSETQKRWLDTLTEYEIDALVCLVQDLTP